MIHALDLGSSWGCRETLSFGHLEDLKDSPQIDESAPTLVLFLESSWDFVNIWVAECVFSPPLFLGGRKKRPHKIHIVMTELSHNYLGPKVLTAKKKARVTPYPSGFPPA